MPNKCSVAGCRSNYDTQKEYKTLFSLPKDDEKKKKWLRKIPTDFSGLKNPFVCIEHFHECDIIRVDEVCVNGVLKQYPRKVPKLKDDAIPSVFPNLPKYLSVNSQLSRRLVDVEQSNFDLATRQSILDQKDYEEKQAIKEVSGILSYFKLLNEKEFPSKWHIQQNSEKLYISLISVNATPVILGHIEVYTNLKFDMYVNKCKVAHSRLPKNTVHINSINILESLLLFLEQEVHKPIEPTALNQVIDILKLINHEEEKKIEFIIDQLKLLQVPKNNRRYCNETVVLAASLYVHSASSYCAVYKCGSFCLPHPRNMQKLISKFSLSSSSLQGSISYLKTKFKYLKEHEILVNLLLDEIYIEPQLNFKAGRIYGSTDSDPTKTAKTAQVFMISSILSSYKDVVCITPVINLTSDLLQSMLLTVIKEVEQIGFKVICLISDNNVINRKAFELLTPNKLLQPVIPHPFDPERQLFILFDSVHILKCIRNNWLNSKNNGTLTFPDTKNHSVFQKAHLKNFEMLFQMEQKSLAKYSHLLSRKVLYPSSIQKQNVNLALKLLNEKNIAALKCISKQYPAVFTDIEGTCSFIETIAMWWKIVNVRSPYEGIHLNDIYREPIRVDSVMQLNFLKDMTLWLKNWKLSVHSTNGLSPQTFQSLIIANEAMVQLIPYLFQKYKMDYILLGKFQTDDLESRFGAYRQLSGSNYYISFVQVLESERKLRFKSCVIVSAKNLNVPLKTLIAFEERSCETVDINLYDDVLNDSLSIECVPSDVLPVLTYISGFVVHKELVKKKCFTCIAWLQLDKTIDIEGPFELIKHLDRGKLIFPSEFSVLAVSCTWKVLNELIEKHEADFLRHNNSLMLLHKLSSVQLSWLALPHSDTCECDFSLFERLESISLLTSKILMNNLVKFKNDKTFTKMSSNRKVKKLRPV